MLLPYADVFVRLCDVDPRGRSYNICDGLVSLTNADHIRGAQVRLWPTAATLLPADQEVHHDPAHPSAVILPVRLSTDRKGLAADG